MRDEAGGGRPALYPHYMIECMIEMEADIMVMHEPGQIHKVQGMIEPWIEHARGNSHITELQGGRRGGATRPGMAESANRPYSLGRRKGGAAAGATPIPGPIMGQYMAARQALPKQSGLEEQT